MKPHEQSEFKISDWKRKNPRPNFKDKKPEAPTADDVSKTVNNFISAALDMRGKNHDNGKLTKNEMSSMF